ncbi:MAG: HNH endonuclease [Deltaproteobacteria bacterium]|nr:HNH endonuclease [Deltaproteobacteria bacterium]
MPLTIQDFQKKLDIILQQAQELGACFIGIRAGDLHTMVGDYPSDNHRMPVSCDAMRKIMRHGDEIIQEPPSGYGASLTIMYKLPRQLQIIDNKLGIAINTK